MNVQHLSSPSGTEGPDAGHRGAQSRTVNLAGIDLNLLVALEALLAERNVTYAANRIGLSQPAMSRALGRLRGLFNDELLVRSSSGFVLTARAEQLAAELPRALNGLRCLLATRDTTPETWAATVSIAMSDHQSLVLLPGLLPRLRARAPGVDITTAPLGDGVLRDLEGGDADFAIGQLRSTPFGFYRRNLYVDPFVHLLRSGHPVLRDGGGAPDRIAGLRQVVIAPGAGDRTGLLHDMPILPDLPDRNPLAVQDTMTAAMVVAETDLMLTVPRRTAVRIAGMLPVAILEPPSPLPDYAVSLVWHERHHRDPRFTWLRSELIAAAMAVANAKAGEVKSGSCLDAA
ncbi:LysR family transcriptional regulator [Arenibaculum pallidiluteum]|uniref:LysR family transcriptional regulator n=1 Tax=Arenibaculum pallidiluteum TaxID=2812559 RepID=UPI001A9701A2|nr:LysR family transcriptional regulator [Arenibaculum pallidiluteum]